MVVGDGDAKIFCAALVTCCNDIDLIACHLQQRKQQQQQLDIPCVTVTICLLDG